MLVVAMVVVEVGGGRMNESKFNQNAVLGKINKITWCRSFNGLEEEKMVHVRSTSVPYSHSVTQVK